MQKEGKHPCVVVAAIANRFLRGLYYRMTLPEEELKAAAYRMRAILGEKADEEGLPQRR